jgi:predicted dinucleotide-binding enzyme
MDRRAFLASTFLFALASVVVIPTTHAQTKPQKIGVIGSGRIGSTIGGLWVKAGHEVMFSDRDPEQAKKVASGLGKGARTGTPEEAVAFGDTVLIAVPYGALPAVAKQVGEKLKGKVVVDPNNPVPARDGELGAQAKEKGAAVSTAALLPGARLVRSFNSWGYMVMAREANRAAPHMAMPVASDDPQALKVGLALVRDAGFEPVPAGSLADSKAFDLGSSVSGKVMSAQELRQALSLKP